MQPQRLGNRAPAEHAPPDAAADSGQAGAAIEGSRAPIDREQFILANLRLQAVAHTAAISIHMAHPASGISRLGLDAPPYWAQAWPGGAALARHLRNHPDTVAGRDVLDIGSGSGLVAIAAARAGARSVTAIEPDPWGGAAIRLNAAANDVTIDVRQGDAAGAHLDADIILAGDVFYAEEVAEPMLAALDRCLAAGAEVLVGDIGRRWLPLDRLDRIATYEVRDFGDPPGTVRPGHVFRLHRRCGKWG